MLSISSILPYEAAASKKVLIHSKLFSLIRSYKILFSSFNFSNILLKIPLKEDVKISSLQ